MMAQVGLMLMTVEVRSVYGEVSLAENNGTRNWLKFLSQLFRMIWWA